MSIDNLQYTRARLAFLEETVLPHAARSYKNERRVVYSVGIVQREILALKQAIHSIEPVPDPRTLKPKRGMLGSRNPQLT